MDLSIGDKVSLKVPLPYLKSADPMPMLRPPDLVSIDEIGIVVGLHSIDTVKVRFRRGEFLISADRLEKKNQQEDSSSKS